MGENDIQFATERGSRRGLVTREKFQDRMDLFHTVAELMPSDGAFRRVIASVQE